ncbi:MAG: U32 family peptidase [Deltaproteobacteria bacterium]|nr:U32 family peptidase [Deltaproteobacteria bacterium]
MARVELLVPAGNREKLEVAIAYGADAVYFGGSRFSLRQRAGNFSPAELPAAIAYCRRQRVKAYLTVNSLPFDRDLPAFSDYLARLRETPPDALIIGDPGVLLLCRRLLPDVPLHLSTQANTLNALAAAFWRANGVSRVNLARELPLAGIRAVVAGNPGLECEVFVHGAMCMAYSGRCLLSAYLTGRHANQGDCAQPCRWPFSLHEEKRPGAYFPVEEDGAGVHIFNARDLCLLARLPELQAAGVSSVKIEGRMKSAYYVAVVTRVYRQALDWLAEHENQPFPEDRRHNWENELTRVSHRRYTEGFFEGTPATGLQHLPDSAYRRSYRFCALVVADENSKRDPDWATLNIKDGVRPGEELEVIGPRMEDKPVRVLALQDEQGRELAVAHPGTTVRALCSCRLQPRCILRRAGASEDEV